MRRRSSIFAMVQRADLEAALNIQQTWPYLTYSVKSELPSLLRAV